MSFTVDDIKQISGVKLESKKYVPTPVNQYQNKLYFQINIVFISSSISNLKVIDFTNVDLHSGTYYHSEFLSLQKKTLFLNKWSWSAARGNKKAKMYGGLKISS